jgi:hypothetical protein
VPVSPGDEYRTRLRARTAAVAALAARDRRFSTARLITFAALVAVIILWWTGTVSPWWSAIPLFVFAALIVRHDRIVNALAAAQRSVAFYERGLARIEDRWSGLGEPGDRFQDDPHPYAADLDLFGRGSLFELLSLARTRSGEETLAEWLKHPAPPRELAMRRGAVDELAEALDLREGLALAGSGMHAGVEGGALTAWAEGPAVLRYPVLRVVAFALTAVTATAAIYGAATGSYAFLVAALVAVALFYIPQHRRVQQALHSAEQPARDLDVLAHVLELLERQRFTAPALAALRGSLETAGIPASIAIRRLHRLIEMHDWQHNQFFAPIGAALLWGTHIAWAIEGWRRVHGVRVRQWLQTAAEFEALASLSAYRYEHPDDVWPEIVEGPAAFEASSLGHPLLPAERMIRNDLSLGNDTRLLVISGSNMSGKSTLLRTVGINAVLAQAGAPVRASSLRMTPLSIGATLRIQDSLQEGRSRFYAEITRIRELADRAAGPVPLLFLLDELFHGTNSHDRLVGASGVLRSLLDRGAIGLITTHDLALTAIADGLAPRAVNVHFEDDFEGGEIRFDYRMKPGPVTRSNALALMRAVGLDIQ